MPYPPFPPVPPPTYGVAFQGAAGGFAGFQVPAFQWTIKPANDYGYSVITPAAQQSGAQPVTPTFVAGSVVRASCALYDTARQPFVPYAFRWRVDDLNSGQNTQWWTNVVLPGTVVPMTIPTWANAFISASLTSEVRQITCEICDWDGQVFLAEGLYSLLYGPGALVMNSFGFQGQGAFQTGAFQTGNVAGT